MMNPWYDKVVGQSAVPQVSQMSGGMQFQNPVQRFQYIMQAMTNPAQFVKNMFPDIPNEALNDPNKVGQYLSQTRGAPTQQMMQGVQQYGQYPGILNR